MQLEITTDNYNKNPFPYLECSDFLDEKTYASLKKDFPSDKFFSRGQVVMGGRKRLSNDNNAFYEFLKKSKSWNDFYNELNSKQFVTKVINTFKADIEQYKPNFNINNFQFDSEYLRNNGIDTSLVGKVKRKLGIGRKSNLFKPIDSNELFMHFDISSANIGYQREIHHDSNQRIANFLIYFSGSSPEDVGGEFVIHKHKVEKPIDQYEHQPKDEDTEVVAKYKPKENLFLMFLSTKNSYHSVPLISNAKNWRNFIYVGISIKNHKAWK